MFDRLEKLEIKYLNLSEDISRPEIIENQDKWKILMKEHSNLSPIVEKYKEYKKVLEDIDYNKEILNESIDEELKQLVKEDLKESLEKIELIKKDLKVLLLPKDPNDEKNVIVEIRGGAGGDEASLFGATLFRMYSRYSERKNWKIEIMNMSENDMGGYKEVSFLIKGFGAYSRLKYESGVHRVQRIPTTESSGRIHTSTVTVAVLPEAEDVDVNLDMNDIRIDVFRSSGNGGQSVNTTDSAVRITHIPTNIVISCQDEKSQLKNKDKALKILRAKLYELELQKQQNELSEERKSQVGTGDRSERIRTYNFPQGRVTDHRINLTLHKIESILDGNLDEILDALITIDQAEKMK